MEPEKPDAGAASSLDPVVYVVDGSKVRTLDDFYAAVGTAVSGPGGYFGRNLDALRDCLSGGYGTPEDRRFAFVLTDSTGVAQRLGHAETARQLESTLHRAHPSNAPALRTQLGRARDGTGPTAFDWLVELFADSGVDLQLS